MALFAKKDKAASANATKASKVQGASGAKKGLKMGRRKDAPTPAGAGQDVNTPTSGAAPTGSFEDFADFSTDTPSPAASAPAHSGNGSRSRKAARPKGLKGGAVVGLNIGNDSIKAVELRGKGENVAVTAMGMVPTPPDSISNGVVMSTSSLSHAIRDLFQKSGIKTKRVITSVAGTGALVVRVIEVPKMSDNELKDNMAVDADRYIPFPPTEVILDFKALRELPTDPDSPNMEVLLAAAQREIVDLHVNVLMTSKLDPRAIDVEPLAATRALFYDGLNAGAGQSDNIDYSDVSAVINIGATNTEISVLRGNILVFTRSIPRGGNVISEALAAELDINIFDAERLKRESGDALPPFGAAVPAASSAAAAYAPPSTPTATADDAATEDWGDFGILDEPQAAGEAWDLTGAGAPAETPTAAEPASPASTDPFDLDFFNQGPRNDEPQEQHQQSERPGGSAPEPFDFSDFTLDEARAAADNLPTQEATPGDGDEFANIISESESSQGGAGAASGDWHTAEHPEEVAPTGQMFHFDTIDDPSLPSFPALPTHLAEGLAGPADDFSNLPTDTGGVSVPETTTPAPPAAGAEAAPGGFSFNFEGAEPIDLGAPVSSDAQEEFAAIPQAETESLSFTMAGSAETVPAPTAEVTGTPSAFDFGSLGTPAESGSDLNDIFAAEPAATSSEETFDIDSIVGPGDDFADTSAMSDILGDTDAFAPSAVDADTPGLDNDFGDLSSFGAALAGHAMTAGISPERVHAVIAPLLEELVGEVRRSLEYYASRYPDSGVRHITLVGGGALLTNIDAYFTQSLGIPTTRGNVFSNVVVRVPQLPAGYANEHSSLYAVALGLALRDLT